MSFTANYLGGLLFPKPGYIVIQLQNDERRICFKQDDKIQYLNYEDIEEVSMDEKKTRSIGKGAAGAIVGGFLTGGIGLIAGAAVGGRKRDASIVYITYKVNGRSMDVMLKPKSGDLFSGISAAIAVPEPANYNREQILATRPSQNTNENSGTQALVFVIIFVVIIYLLCK